MEKLRETGRSEFGNKGPCVFYKLQSYKSNGQFPLDSLHDLLEKVIPCDAASILFDLIKQGHFTLAEYNTMMRKSCLQGYEVRDRPRIVKPRSEKLPGKALSVSLHIRLMPYVIWRLLGEPEETVDNELLDLLGILHSLNDFLHADKVNFADIRNL